MEENEIMLELDNRYCPICGISIKKGSPLHRCSDKDLEKIDKSRNKKKAKIDRTFDDRLKEFEDYYNPDTYYDKEEENV